MNKQDVTKQETLRVAQGLPICAGIFLAGTAVAGAFSLSMVVGTLLGCGYSLFSFVLLGWSLETALAKDPVAAQRYMSGRYFLRLGLTAIVIIVSFQVDIINPVGMIVPLFFPKLIIHTRSILEKGGKK